jgi:hypothetical protein
MKTTGLGGDCWIAHKSGARRERARKAGLEDRKRNPRAWDRRVGGEGSPRPRPPRQLAPHLGRADHALGHVQVALVVLADLGNDEARVLPAHPASGT